MESIFSRSSGAAEAVVLRADDTTPTTKCQRVFATMMKFLQCRLSTWSLPAWNEIKENNFSAPIAKFTALKVESAHTEKEEFVAETDEWITKHGGGKDVVNKYRLFNKYQRTVSKRSASLAPFCWDWVNFLRDRGVDPHFTLEALRPCVGFMVCPDARWQHKVRATRIVWSSARACECACRFRAD